MTQQVHPQPKSGAGDIVPVTPGNLGPIGRGSLPRLFANTGDRGTRRVLDQSPLTVLRGL